MFLLIVSPETSQPKPLPTNARDGTPGDPTGGLTGGPLRDSTGRHAEPILCFLGNNSVVAPDEATELRSGSVVSSRALTFPTTHSISCTERVFSLENV